MPMLHDALHVGQSRTISRAQEDRVEMFLELLRVGGPIHDKIGDIKGRAFGAGCD
jgi:hypothetical protein